MALRNDGLEVEVDSWRVYTISPIDFFDLPTDIASLKSLVQENLQALIRKIQFSYHFYQVPEDLQLQEIYSILDLPRITNWFTTLKNAKPINLNTSAIIKH